MWARRTMESVRNGCISSVLGGKYAQRVECSGQYRAGRRRTGRSGEQALAQRELQLAVRFLQAGREIALFALLADLGEGVLHGGDHAARVPGLADVPGHTAMVYGIDQRLK